METNKKNKNNNCDVEKMGPHRQHLTMYIKTK